MKSKKLKSLSIFFPFFNDKGTVEEALSDAYKYGGDIAEKLEVIAIHGGKSHDNTFAEIKRMKKIFPLLKIIDKTDNTESYAVIKHGFYQSTREWIIYTDGDLQYDLSEMSKFVKKQFSSNADVINGYRKVRRDTRWRIFLGKIYTYLSRVLFRLPIRDLTCDYRLIRKGKLNSIEFNAADASILLELIKKLEFQNARFAEVEVRHFNRRYGTSTYNWIKLIKERILGDIKTWYSLKK